MQLATDEDKNLAQLKNFLRTNWPKPSHIPSALRSYYALRNELTVIDGCVIRGSVFVVPDSLIPRVIECAHQGHPGISRTKLRAQQCFWWPQMSASIEAYVRECSVS